MPTVASCTVQPRQGATVSRGKVAATAKTLCGYGNLPHLFSLDPVSLCIGELSPPQPQSTRIYKYLQCIVSLWRTVSTALCDLTDVLRLLSTALPFQYTQL